MTNSQTKSIARFTTLVLTMFMLPALGAQELSLESLVGTWNMSYDMGQGTQTGTINISQNAEGEPAITMNTQGGGNSTGRNIEIDGDEISWTRGVSAQGQSITVNYVANLVGGQLQGTFELDLGGFDAGGPVSWTATRQ